MQKDTYRLLHAANQRKHFKDELDFFANSDQVPAKDVPELVTRLNLFCDKGILHVRSKFDKWFRHGKQHYPVLLSKKSNLTRLIIRHLHENKGHSGIYSVLNELRRLYYVPCHFSVVKSVLKCCVSCIKVNNRPIQLNQNSYRNFRSEPDDKCYKNCFIDHFGPYFVRMNGKKCKVYVLLITCMWSRNINLKLCFTYLLE